MSGPCPSPQQWLDYAAGRVAHDTRASLAAHLDGCETCLAVAAEAIDEHRHAPTTDGRNRPRAPPPPLPERLNRYVVLEMLGAGGMGEVLLAYDPALDRKVAVKLARPRQGDDTQALETRLQREAQALARAVDPHVVAVFDTGRVGSRPYVAMEYVPGATLKGWLSTPRSRKEILRVFIEAGRGLAAAHRVGVVHRDFKPDNVLIDAAGRARVTDFGLATFKEQQDETIDNLPAQDDDETQQVYAGTQSGTVLGTPGYMPPEQWDAKPTDARSDQFSFCVALHEALLGQRPFVKASIRGTRPSFERTGTSLARLKEQPAVLRAVLTRGLALEPARRFESMEAVLAQLEKLQRPARWPWLVAAGLASTLAIGGVASTSRPACEGALDRITSVRLALAPLEKEPLALAQALEQRWAQAWQTGCVETLETKEQPPEVRALRSDCLRRQESRYRQVLTQLGAADALQRSKALDALAQSPAPEDCLRVASLLQPEPPPAGAGARAASLGDEVHAARVAVDLGQFDVAREKLPPLAGPVEALGYGRLRAEYAFALGLLAQKEHDRRQARQHYHRALGAAVAARDHELAASTGIELLFSLAQMGLVEEGELTDELTGALVARAGRDALAAHLENSRGAVALERDRFDDAQRHFENSLRLARAAHGPQHFEVARALANLGSTLTRRERAHDAEAPLREALSIVTQMFGSKHLRVLQMQDLLADALLEQNRAAEAIALGRAALAARRELLGEAHALTRKNQGLLAKYLQTAGEFDEARALREALRSTAAPESLDAAIRMTDLAELEFRAGNLDTALDWSRRAQRLYAKHLAPGEDRALWEREQEAAILIAARRAAEADNILAALEREWRTHLDADGRLADVLLLRTQALLLMGQPKAALPVAEQAGSLYTKVAPRTTRAFMAELGVAKTWWELGQKKEAVVRARTAREALVQHLPNTPKLAEFDDWLATHH